MKKQTKAQRIAAAQQITGTLSAPSKMPCHSYSIPASRCITGSKLREVEGSTCSDCYACKGRYVFPNVQNALETRYASLEHPLWVEAMVALISMTGDDFFRWHDSGDLQSIAHFQKIVDVCNALPNVRFWIPTREYKIVADYRKQGGIIPANLTVRLSAHMVDGAAPNYGLPTSTVHSSAADNPLKVLNTIPANSHYCPSPSQGNKCGDCRACWDANVANVSYHIH